MLLTQAPHIVKTWEEFSEITIRTNDLDPMYEVIAGMHQTDEWMGRFLMYFLCFYHAGDAATCADATDDKTFWEYMVTAAMDPKVKRAAERRHFRGSNALRALATLQGHFMAPYELIHSFWGPTYSELNKVMTNRFQNTQMGPYFIWKIYDIQNVCLNRHITLSMDEAMKFMPAEPRKAAETFFPKQSFRETLQMIVQHIRKLPHPVLKGYGCGLAEAETILCMMKGYFQSKAHVIGDDIDDKFYQLMGHPQLQILLPPRINKNAFARGEFDYGKGMDTD